VSILIIGATGTIGREVVSQLAGSDVRVRAMTRNPQAAKLPRGVDVVQGDLTVPDSIERAVDSVECVFLVWTAPPDAAPETIARIAKHARRLVYLTAPHKTPHPFFQQPNAVQRMHAANESAIEASGLRWTFVRPGMFAANTIMWWGQQIRSGDVVRWPYANAPTAPIDERDVAAVVVRALLDEQHDGGDYVITGPESLTHREQVQIIGDVLGRSLRYEEMSPGDFRAMFGAAAGAANMLLNAWSAAIGQPAYMTRTVETITARPARTFREWATDHRSAFEA